MLSARILRDLCLDDIHSRDAAEGKAELRAHYALDKAKVLALNSKFKHSATVQSPSLFDLCFLIPPAFCLIQKHSVFKWISDDER